ncbi:hypothetical protein ACIRSU_11800 [Streptomyces sp. NPDC101160]
MSDRIRPGAPGSGEGGDGLDAMESGSDKVVGGSVKTKAQELLNKAEPR